MLALHWVNPTMMTDYFSLLRLPTSLSGATCLNLSGLGDEFQNGLVARGASNIVTIGEPGRAPTMDELRSVGGRFDFIFLYLDQFFDSDLRSVRSFVQAHLAIEGRLLVECTVAGSLFEKRWTATVLEDRLTTVPTFRLVTESLLQGFAVRDVGRSPEQVRPRRSSIFLCRSLKPTILLIRGQSGAGKTILSRQFSQQNATVLNFDFLYSELLHQRIGNDPSLELLSKRMNLSKIGSSIDAMVNDGLSEYLVDISLPYFRCSEELLVAEGYQFSVPSIFELTRRKLRQNNFRVETIDLVSST